MFVRA